MAMIDMTTYIEQSGMRKARFGGYEPEDVRQAMLALCSEYEQNIARADAAARTATQEAEALRRRCQTLQGQNRTLASQNANLAGQADQYVRHHDSVDAQLASLSQRNRSLTDQCAVLRMKNSDLTRSNKELTEQAEEAEANLRVKGKLLDDDRAKLAAEKEEILNTARKEAADLVAAAKAQGEGIVHDAELKAEAIDATAREQAVAQARKLVQSASDETKEIQSAHRLRLEDLKRQVGVMEQRRTELIEYLSRMGAELRDIEELARQQAPAPLAEEEDTPTPEPELDLSDGTVGAAADALRAAKAGPDAPGQGKAKPGVADATPDRATRVVAPGLLDTPAQGDGAARAAGMGTNGPSPEYFDMPEESDPEDVPGAIFSYPILRQHGEPILLEDPPLRGPHTPVMPTAPQDDEDEGEDGYGAQQATDPYAYPQTAHAGYTTNAPHPVNSTQSAAVRRRKAVTAVRAILRQRGDFDMRLL